MNDRYKKDLFHNPEMDRRNQTVISRVSDDLFKTDKAVIAVVFEKNASKKERIEIESQWITTIPTLDNIERLYVRHRVSQEIFDSICEMKNLKAIYFDSSYIEDFTAISKLQKLEVLYLDSFTRLTDISPISKLRNLQILHIERCFKVINYNEIGKLTNLIALRLWGDAMGPKNLQLPSLKPFVGLKKLRHLNVSSTSIIDKSYEAILELSNLERFDALFKVSEPLKTQILQMPKLDSGFFVDYDFKQNKFKEGKDWEMIIPKWQ